MSGHSKWKQIAHKKGATDLKRGRLFSKLLRAISIAAKSEPNPQFNPRLRSAIEKAKENNVPADNIERAVSKASEAKNLEDVVVEAYGPEGSALIITAVTDSKNRTIGEIWNVLNEYQAKMATPGSVLWAFDPPPAGGQDWVAKFPQEISDQAKEHLQKLIDALEENEDVQKVYTNIK